MASPMKYKTTPPPRRALGAAALILAIIATAALTGCGDKETEAKKPGQAIASVNGEEITTMQLNEELQRANIAPANQQAASRQLVRVLVDRQLLQHEAEKEKLDRDPKVMQAIERAKALIIAQAYMQKHIGTQAKPTRAEVEAYFNAHPEFFSKRKAFDMQQLVIATRDLTPEAKKAAETSKSLEELAAWFDANKVKYARNRVTRSTADMPPELSAKLMSMQNGQIFAVREGERSLLVSIADVRDAPVTVDIAAQQIEQFLMNKKNKDAADAELARLRSTAKIEYLNKDLVPDATAPAAPAAMPAAADTAATASPANTGDAAVSTAAQKAALDRGVAGLK